MAPGRRWFSIFPLCIWPMMLMAGERYLIHCIHISTLITPGAIFLCRHTYSPDLLPQFDLEAVPMVNFDQFTLLPVVVCVWLMVRQRRGAALLLCCLGFRGTCRFRVCMLHVRMSMLAGVVMHLPPPPASGILTIA